jgi:hypothetical protein
MQQLRFSRVPAPLEEADEGAGDDASSISSTSSFNKQAGQQQRLARQQQQSVEPIPVEIPNIMRHVNSFGRMAAGSVGAAQPAAGAAAAASGGNSSSGGGGAKFDPLASRKKGGKPKQQQPAVPAAAVNGSSGAAGGDEDGPPPLEGSSDSLADLVAGLDVNVASHLDPANLPAFLRTPERRDGQDSLPTQSY